MNSDTTLNCNDLRQWHLYLQLSKVPDHQECWPFFMEQTRAQAAAYMKKLPKWLRGRVYAMNQDAETRGAEGHYLIDRDGAITARTGNWEVLCEL